MKIFINLWSQQRYPGLKIIAKEKDGSSISVYAKEPIEKDEVILETYSGADVTGQNIGSLDQFVLTFKQRAKPEVVILGDTPLIFYKINKKSWKVKIDPITQKVIARDAISEGEEIFFSQ